MAIWPGFSGASSRGLIKWAPSGPHKKEKLGPGPGCVILIYYTSQELFMNVHYREFIASSQ